jgi:hypothetical protein
VDNYIDIIASGIFFTDVYMANKKKKTGSSGLLGYNSKPLYAYQLEDVIITIFNFTILAISAYIEWRKS